MPTPIGRTGRARQPASGLQSDSLLPAAARQWRAAYSADRCCRECYALARRFNLCRTLLPPPSRSARWPKAHPAHHRMRSNRSEPPPDRPILPGVSCGLDWFSWVPQVGREDGRPARVSPAADGPLSDARADLFADDVSFETMPITYPIRAKDASRTAIAAPTSTRQCVDFISHDRSLPSRTLSETVYTIRCRTGPNTPEGYTRQAATLLRPSIWRPPGIQQ